MNDVKETENKRYEIARLAVAVIAVLTAANIVIGLATGKVTFVVTAALPEIFSLVGLWSYAAKWPLYITVLCGAVIVLLLAAYVLCWALSKKRRGALTAATILYGIDFVFRLYLLVCDVMDGNDWLMTAVRVVFPIVVLVLLIRGRISK